MAPALVPLARESAGSVRDKVESTDADAVTLLPPLSREAQSGVCGVLPIAGWLVPAVDSAAGGRTGVTRRRFLFASVIAAPQVAGCSGVNRRRGLRRITLCIGNVLRNASSVGGGRTNGKRTVVLAPSDVRGIVERACARQDVLDACAKHDEEIGILEDKIAACLNQIPAAQGVDSDGATGPAAGTGPDAAALPAVEQLAEIPGVSEDLARAIIGETGLDMTRFPTAAHLVSWAGLAPVTRQSGPRTRKAKKSQGDSYLRGLCTQAANGTARTGTFLGERLRRITKTPRRRQGTGRGRALHPHHHLAPPRRPRSTLH